MVERANGGRTYPGEHMHTATSTRKSVVAIATAMLVVVSVLSAGGALSPVTAQSSTEHVFSGGEVLAWGGKWQLQGDLTYKQGGLEIATLSTGVANLHVLAIPADASKSEIRDTFLDG